MAIVGGLLCNTIQMSSQDLIGQAARAISQKQLSGVYTKTCGWVGRALRKTGYTLETVAVVQSVCENYTVCLRGGSKGVNKAITSSLS